MKGTFNLPMGAARVAALVVAWGLLQPRLALACAACYGKADGAMAAGMNWGIVSLLVIIGGVLAGVAAFFIFLSRKAAAAAATSAPQAVHPTQPLAEVTR